MRISKRLQEVAKYVQGYKSLADIACDHGYLGIYAIIYYQLDDVLLTDINDLPLQSAKENCLKYNVVDKVNFALGDGLRPLEKDYDVISICGIGGLLMVAILKDGINRIKKAQRIILCPNTDSYEVRKFLCDEGFEITIEEIVFDYKYYEIIVARYVESKQKYSELELKYGPILLKNKSNEFINHYKEVLLNLENNLAKINDIKAKNKLDVKIEELKTILD